jgi:hypothetical protein
VSVYKSYHCIHYKSSIKAIIFKEDLSKELSNKLYCLLFREIRFLDKIYKLLVKIIVMKCYLKYWKKIEKIEKKKEEIYKIVIKKI